MTNAELLAKIKAEIERNRQAIRVLNEHTAPEQMSKTCAIFQYSDTILSAILTFLSTLESENPMNLMAEIKQYYSDNFDLINGNNPTLNIVTHIARHFYELGRNAN